jgi:hypothetical protein
MGDALQWVGLLSIIVVSSSIVLAARPLPIRVVTPAAASLR